MTKTEQLIANLAALRFERDGSSVGTAVMSKTCEDGSYMLITNDEGASLPEHGKGIVIGHYDADSNPLNMVLLAFNVDRYEVDADDYSAASEEVQATIDAICVEYK